MGLRAAVIATSALRGKRQLTPCPYAERPQRFPAGTSRVDRWSGKRVAYMPMSPVPPPGGPCACSASSFGASATITSVVGSRPATPAGTRSTLTCPWIHHQDDLAGGVAGETQCPRRCGLGQREAERHRHVVLPLVGHRGQ